MQTVTLTRVARKDVETKYGIKPNVGIQTEEHGDKWLSTFKVSGTENWKEGDKVDIEVRENNGYLNFDPVFENLEVRVKKLEDAVFGAKEKEKQNDPESDF